MQLPREKAQQIGCAYARYSSRFQHSIGDQIRTIFEAAVRLGIFIPRENVFFDTAVRGFKDKRAGLNGLRALLNGGKHVDVFLAFTTNRLYRKNYKSLQFVEEEIVERGVRCIFVKSGIDSADEKRWRMLLQIHAMTDEFVVGMYADNIRAAHEGLFDKRMVCGTISFGYFGEPIPGEFTRTKKPRCRIVIESEAAEWVRRIFEWYVVFRLSIGEIVRRLNADDSIPLGPKSSNGQWTYDGVRYVLNNPRYRGWWRYGVTEAVWQSKKDYSRQIERAEPLRSAQFHELRIVTDEIWYKAAERLAKNDQTAAGRKPRDGDGSSRPKLLNGTFFCPVHDTPLYVGGSYGKYMFCRRCGELPRDQRTLYSMLPRELAMQLTCRKLAELITADSQLVDMVIAVFAKQVETCQLPDASQLDGLRKQDSQLRNQIQFLTQNPGETDEDQRDSAVQLKDWRRQKAEVTAKLKVLESPREVTVPDAAQVRKLVGELGEVLAAAADGQIVEEIGMAREIISVLTGGRIELYQEGEASAQSGWLQGRFRVSLVNYVVSKFSDRAMECDGTSVDVVIDYREPDVLSERAEQAKALEDQGLLVTDIGKKLGVNRNQAAEALDLWYSQHGLERPDGRVRRSELKVKQTKVPKYKEIADVAKELRDEGMSDVQIAAQLECSPPTVINAIAHWHRERSLPVPDSAQRHQDDVDRIKALSDKGMLIKDIAPVVGLSSRSVTLLLQEWFKSRGLEMPDGRTRRFDSNRGT